MSEDKTKPPAGYAVREVGFGYMVVLACDTGPLVLRDGGAAVMAARAHRDAVKRDGWVEAEQRTVERIAAWIRNTPRIDGHMVPIEASQTLALLADAIDRGDWKEGGGE